MLFQSLHLKASDDSGTLRLDGCEVPYIVARSAKRRRTITLSFTPDHILRIQTPLRANPRTIARLLEERRGWITRRLEKLSRLPSLQDEFSPGQMLPYLGAQLRLEAVTAPGKSGCAIEGDTLKVTYRPDREAAPEIRRLVLNWYKSRAKAILAERIAVWAGALGVKYRRLTLNNARRLWGTCSTANDIRINWRIIMAPLPLVDCLLAHELCHVVHKNHSKRFWGLLERTIPDQAERKKQLRVIEKDLLRRAR